jgi:hypothetical protein
MHGRSLIVIVQAGAVQRRRDSDPHVSQRDILEPPAHSGPGAASRGFDALPQILRIIV